MLLSAGDKVRDYEIIAPIRSGGMAMLYLARRRGVGGFSRLVALKLVHPHLIDDPDINRLFLQEARIAASVAHPNVVNVEEAGSADGKYFIAMEYVHGVSLDELLATMSKRRLRMSPKLCIWVAAAISEALHAVHAATRENGVPLNIVHRDVSPQNVLVGHTGHIKLIDFGIAKSQLASQQVSSRGSVIGKLRYMAPEQLRMQPISSRTDVYALGVLVWEMLTARNLLRCFRIDDERDWATREHPPAPSMYTPNLPPGIDRAVLRALACHPGERFEGALAFRAALLRAEPAASQVDAPQFAALIRDLLGEELDRRRADWPNEVKVELDSGVVVDPERSLGVEQLTARLRAEDAADTAPGEEEQDEPTLCDSPAALRLERDEEETVVRHDQSLERTVVQRLQNGEGRSATRPPSPEALIPTIAAPPSNARPHSRLERAMRSLQRRAGVLGTASLALGIALLAFFASSLQRRSLSIADDDAAGTRSLVAESAQPSLAADGGAPLRLHETHIVSTAQPHAHSPLDAGALSHSAKRPSAPLRPKGVRAKSKLVQRTRKPARR